jgi:CheY-like chemotaxis protein
VSSGKVSGLAGPEILVWLIDDDSFFSFLFQKIVHGSLSEHSEVWCSSSGSQALLRYDLLQAQSSGVPDLIFIDINMPIMDGWELLAELNVRFEKKLTNPDVYIISSSITQEDRKRALAIPFVKGYITKPVDWRELCCWIREKATHRVLSP